MSSAGGAAGVVAAAAAAAARLKQEQEEEEMTSYSPKDLAEDWEFKILRTANGTFGDPVRFRAILDEEKRGGWTLVEKFDDCRIRLKRPAAAKVVEEDLADGYDPYRTQLPFSLSETTPGFLISLVAISVFALIIYTLAISLGILIG